MSNWILSSIQTPDYGQEVECSDSGKPETEYTAIYLEKRTCMLAGYAGGSGYFGEGFATDGSDNSDYGLIIDTPLYWRPIE